MPDSAPAPMVWLASYPRSGNTLLRTILWHCFGLHSGSLYPNDLGGNKALESYVGHIEHGPNHIVTFPRGERPLIKTHEYPKDAKPAIYVVRDARAASISLWQFYNRQLPLEAVIGGRHHFGTWAAHLEAWRPWERPDTLLLKYEDMTRRLPEVLTAISAFLACDIRQQRIPERSTIADTDGRWVRQKHTSRPTLSGPVLETFLTLNQDMMKKMGYE